jgi:serine/threonine-protein kinase
MSPEQAQGLPIDARSDVFSLGAILYEMVTGHRAFDAPKVEDLLASLVRDEPVPVNVLRPDAPVELVRIIARAMAKDVEQRYQTAGELRNELTAFAGGLDPETLAARPELEGRGRRRALGWSAAAAAIAASVSLWAMRRGEPPQPPAPEPVVATPAAVPPAPRAEPSAQEQAEPVAPPAARRAAPAPPPADGRITLAIAPWGEVLVNGQSRGVSPPLTSMTLPPGSYAIEVRNGDLPPLKTSVEVRPGQTQTLRHRF